MGASEQMLERTEQASTSDSIEVRLTGKTRRGKTQNSAVCTTTIFPSKQIRNAVEPTSSIEPEEVSGPVSPPHSAEIVLPDESQSEWNQLVKDWLDAYKPQDALTRSLVLRAASADWILRRNQTRYNQIEQSLYSKQPDSTEWDTKQVGFLDKILRHRSAAERSFYQARTAIEKLRSHVPASREVAQHSRVLPSPSAHATEPNLEAAKPRPQGAIIQCVTVQVINGKTFTLYQPRNEYFQRMIEGAREPKPIVKRALYFLHGVPDEYSWVSDCENHDGTSHFTFERSCQEALSDLAREQAEKSMHVLPIQ